MTDLVLGRINEDTGVANNDKLASSSDLLSLRKVAQDRIINEMLAKVKENCTYSPEYTILVLDSFTARLFTALNISFYELYQHNVYQVEDLAKQRKRYPMSDVIYFVEPTRRSVGRVMADFPE